MSSTTNGILTPTALRQADVKPASVVRLVRGRWPILVRREEAAAMLSVSVPTLDRMQAGGLMPEGSRVGGTRMFATEELKAWAKFGCPPRGEWVPLWKTLRRRR